MVFNWRKKKEPKEPEVPAIVPAPVTPEVSEIKPSNFQVINYVRALLILKNTPFKKLYVELKKLPWLDIFYVLGVLVWIFMSGLFGWQLIKAFEIWPLK